MVGHVVSVLLTLKHHVARLDTIVRNADPVKVDRRPNKLWFQQERGADANGGAETERMYARPRTFFTVVVASCCGGGVGRHVTATRKTAMNTPMHATQGQTEQVWYETGGNPQLISPWHTRPADKATDEHVLTGQSINEPSASSPLSFMFSIVVITCPIISFF